MDKVCDTKLLWRCTSVVFVVYLVCALYLVFTRGPWLDEFWTIWMADPSLPFQQAYRSRWLTDLHPPLFYFLVWCMRHVVGDQYSQLRLVNFVPAFILVPTVLSWRARKLADPWLAVFAVLVLSSPYFLAYFAELRSYYILAALGACLMIQLKTVRLLSADVSSRDWVLIALTIVTILLVLNLHYSGSLVFLIVISFEILIALINRRYKWMFILIASVLIASVPLLVNMAATLKVVHPFSYLTSTPLHSATIILSGILLGAVINIGVDFALIKALIARRAETARRVPWSVATLAVAALAVFVQSLVNHAMSMKYVLDLAPLSAAVVADLAAYQVCCSSSLTIVMALCAIVLQCFTAHHESHNKRWFQFTDNLRQLARQCRTTQFVGVDVNAFPEYARHPKVSGWIGVFGEGYDAVSRQINAPVIVTRSDADTDLKFNACPIVILSEHEVYYPKRDLPGLLKAARVNIDRYQTVVTKSGDYQHIYIMYR